MAKQKYPKRIALTSYGVDIGMTMAGEIGTKPIPYLAVAVHGRTSWDHIALTPKVAKEMRDWLDAYLKA